MNFGEIIGQSREWLDDEVGGDGPDATPYLWRTGSLRRWGNEAQDEACSRMRLLVDSRTAAVCRIPTVAGVSSYRLHPSIIVARRFEFTAAPAGSRPQLLTRTTFDALDRTCDSWTANTGRPCAVVQDLQAREFRLDRIPTADTLGTVALTAWRKPLESEQLEVDDDDPVIDSQYHIHLAHWICYRAFLRKDTETYDEKRAAMHLEQFRGCFGDRPTAARLRQLATDQAGETQAYWF